MSDYIDRVCPQCVALAQANAALTLELTACEQARLKDNEHLIARQEAERALTRIAVVMGCQPDDDDDLIDAVRLLKAERDEARARVRELHKALYDALERERDEVLARLDALLGGRDE